MTPAASPSFPLPTAHLTCKRCPTPVRRNSCRCVLPLPLFFSWPHPSSPPTFRPANRPPVQPVPIASHSESGETSIKTYQRYYMLILIPYVLPLPPRLSRLLPDRKS